MTEKTIILDDRRFLILALITAVLSGFIVGIPFGMITYFNEGSLLNVVLITFTPVIIIFLLALVLLGKMIGFNDMYEVRLNEDNINMKHINKNLHKEYPVYSQLIHNHSPNSPTFRLGM